MTDHGPGFNYQFNAQQYAPNQGGGGGKHPVGKHQATITDTQVKPTNEKTGHYLEVTYTTQMGSATDRFNINNPSSEAVRIGHEQLSALCHATGIFMVDMNNHGAALRGARLMIEVGLQNNPEAQEKGYTEVKKRLDVNGNEPGKTGNNPAPNGFAAPGGFTPQQQPQQQQPNGQMPQQFAQPQQNQQPQQQQPQPNAGGAWGNNPQPQQQAPQQQQPNPAGWGAPQQNGQPQQQPNQQPAAWGAPQG